MAENILAAIARTKIAIEANPEKRWILAYSGGKDSTATLKIFIAALRNVEALPVNASLIYCDTGVENPLIDEYVKRTLRKMEMEFAKKKISISVQLLKAPVKDRFFVKVAGRGYPTPTNSFRWCTKGLRINPVSDFIQEGDRENTVVLLGSRRNESEQRRRSISKFGDDHWQTQKEGRSKVSLYLPILDFTISDVWDTLFMIDNVSSISAREIEGIYRDASGECPVLRSPTAPPCASGRFGCWTCTVVRRDKSALKLIEAGHSNLAPFLEFRNWLSVIRNDHQLRWPVRRNGSELPGPFSTCARQIILHRLLALERLTNTKVLDEGEIESIFALWEQDHEIERGLGITPADEDQTRSILDRNQSEEARVI
ncbi:phosphoadenosine phosphosulfate reductase family protein [Paracoccus onubensis]|uniref:phosphoadenosine phosphosulfate reductase domain-containing protein n=1 Tax=Paracoccus onubensis TaxID=1675788 RepID=UPI002731411A|nr:phosphoadenosine phosphosulfate reductase family protein [Paracoccus onubensis]MDP0930046.1 phosphoadenosine phosphosulfate reductase family protein [Paracoccus onubensis]